MRQIVCSTYRRKFIIFSLRTRHFSLFFAKIVILLDRIIRQKGKSVPGNVGHALHEIIKQEREESPTLLIIY